MLPRPTESSLAQDLRTMLGIMSGPTALDVFRLDKSFSTPLESINIARSEQSSHIFGGSHQRL